MGKALKSPGIPRGDRHPRDATRDGLFLKAHKKSFEGASHADRDAQFQHINSTGEAFEARGQSVISVQGRGCGTWALTLLQRALRQRLKGYRRSAPFRSCKPCTRRARDGRRKARGAIQVEVKKGERRNC
jgi:hypothetical protein